jgi:hypothetical protein
MRSLAQSKPANHDVAAVIAADHVSVTGASDIRKVSGGACHELCSQLVQEQI